ncbi:MAG: hypothetical protein Q8P67_13330, partial [archaeon]|nr:hypothetical protein [archaeon]
AQPSSKRCSPLPVASGSRAFPEPPTAFSSPTVVSSALPSSSALCWQPSEAPLETQEPAPEGC